MIHVSAVSRLVEEKISTPRSAAFASALLTRRLKSTGAMIRADKCSQRAYRR